MSGSHAVLYVAAPAQFGGLERVLVELARGMHGRGHAVHALAFLDVGGVPHPLLTELAEAGVPTHAVEVPPRAYGVERAALRRLASETRARIVHTHGTRVDVVDGPAARRLGLATVSTLHGFTGGGWKNSLYEWLQVRAIRSGDAVVAVARPMAERLGRAGVPPERLHVIPNAWAPRQAGLPRDAARAVLGLPADGFRIGWVGRMTSEKGADVLLDAVPGLGDLGVAVSFVGGGRQESALRDRAKALGLSGRVTWHGPVTDAYRVLAAFDLLVISSRTEGTPMLLFEAMAAGVPVVTTAVGGIPDVVGAGEAVLVPPDQPGALARAIREAVIHREEGAVRARAAARLLETRYGVEPWLDAYERVYDAILRRRG